MTISKLYGECRYGYMIQILINRIDHDISEWHISAVAINVLYDKSVSPFYCSCESSPKIKLESIEEAIGPFIDQIEKYLITPIDEVPINDPWIYGALSGWILKNSDTTELIKNKFTRDGELK